MNSETDAIIRELEDQRNFFATRCTRFAAANATAQAEMGALRAANADKQKRISDMEAELTRLRIEPVSAEPGLVE